MSKGSQVTVSLGCLHWLGLGVAATAVLGAMKLSGHLDWDWTWVLAPIWGPPAAALGVLAGLSLGGVLVAMVVALLGFLFAIVCLPFGALIEWIDRRV